MGQHQMLCTSPGIWYQLLDSLPLFDFHSFPFTHFPSSFPYSFVLFIFSISSRVMTLLTTTGSLSFMVCFFFTFCSFYSSYYFVAASFLFDLPTRVLCNHNWKDNQPKGRSTATVLKIKLSKTYRSPGFIFSICVLCYYNRFFLQPGKE